MSDLKGKVAVVTGASKGIGAAIAKSLSAAGAAVVVNYTFSKENADRIVADIKATSGEAIAVKGDVTKADDVRRLFAETKKAFDTLDVLVNNAGVYKCGPLEEITEDEFHREFNINVLGTLLATKEAAKHFRPNGGSVINMSSTASRGSAQAAIYSGTKGAVDAITRGLAAELGPRKIRVNAIAPGGVETEGTHSADLIGGDFEKAMIARTPLGRIGQPDDIACVAVFLASDDSAWLTGERLTVTAALIGLDGAIDFLCRSRFDSSSMFASLLDDERGGSFELMPMLHGARHRQLYLPDTNVLLTRFLSSDGVAEISDFVSIGASAHAENP